ncbi:16S rRNA (guanine(966)-N(2))-methyltransferase RsmD [Geomonas sp. Red32]|uniref:16S rRNA (guanine(966)-N(2))-methyltransferase RsmD n=1 Tax=Geomonas sp. Red32 TaxID=2912856 RepID=UPI00202CACC0|nr:16S rRNA (guanine(966)-N(2))-methyltransferase RsmD [Geomonas sp. Red32]MCM0083653.1 16S rRNA (guanine(966)-N(2))-methyltransferase RsmD [Geomonas sp. Red32]
MRIIAGEARGRTLHAPKNMRVRPTADRVKEALFSMLMSRLGEFDGMRVLDIFAGTGNLGIEALSRGSQYAVFVDSHRESAEIVKKNLELTHFTGKAKVVVQEAALALKNLERNEAPFHLVFLDPPYSEGHTERILEHLSHSPLVDGGTTVVAEFSAKEQIPTAFGRLQEYERRVYGDTALSFLTLTDRGEQCP